MADPAINSMRIDNLESDVVEVKGTVRGLEDECSDLSDRVHSGEIWRNGNGGRGAEARLQLVEVEMNALKICVERVASDESIAKIAHVAVQEVIKNARNRDQTTISKIRAFAPYFAAMCALIAGVIAVLIR